MNCYILGDLGHYYLEQCFGEKKRLKLVFNEQIRSFHYQYQADVLAHLEQFWTPTALQPIFDLLERIGAKTEPDLRKHCLYLTFPEHYYIHAYGCLIEKDLQFSSLEVKYDDLTDKLIRIFHDRFKDYVGHGLYNKLFYLSDGYIQTMEDFRLINKFHLYLKPNQQ